MSVWPHANHTCTPGGGASALTAFRGIGPFRGPIIVHAAFRAGATIRRRPIDPRVMTEADHIPATDTMWARCDAYL
jgi:hypothetical protein